MFYLYHNNLNNVQNIFANPGYSDDKLANSKILYFPIEIIKKNTLYTFSVILKNI